MPGRGSHKGYIKVCMYGFKLIFSCFIVRNQSISPCLLHAISVHHKNVAPHLTRPVLVTVRAVIKPPIPARWTTRRWTGLSQAARKPLT